MTHTQWDQYADLVDARIGDGGDDLHVRCIDPLISQYVGNTSGKTVVDLGCGNAYLSQKMSPGTIYIGVDSSAKLLEKARKHCPDAQIIHADIEQDISLPPESCDIIIANMVLQYASDLSAIGTNVHRLLRPGGIFVVIIDHPSHALFARAQSLAGKTEQKFIDLASYFMEGERTKHSLWDKAILTYYHRIVATYVNTFAKTFRLARMDETSVDGEIPRILGMKWIQ